MHLFFKFGLLTPLIVFAQTSTPPATAQINPIQQVQGVPAQQPIQPQSQPQIPPQAQVQQIQPIQPAEGAPQPAAPQPQNVGGTTQNTAPVNPPPPDASQSGAFQTASPPRQPPPPTQPAPRPLQVAAVPTTGDSKLPADFEFISISPYYKNKPRLGKLTATVVSTTNEILGTVTGDFGDCKSCIRGASIKGKLGVRFYGQSLNSLTVSRKQSSSIQIENCPTNVLVIQRDYSCDFVSGGNKMKLNMRIEP